MAVQEIKNFIPNIGFRNVVSVAGKVRDAALTILNNNSKTDWIIIDAEDLTEEKLKEFISGRKHG